MKSILIVEDEYTIARGIKTGLKYLDYTKTYIAQSGVKALEIIKEKNPDLILADIVLGGKISGIGLAQQVKKKYNIPLIFITAHSDEDIVKKAMVTEPYGYLIKPFPKRELQIIIEIAFHKFEMDQKLRESEERFRQIVERSSDVFYRQNINTFQFEYTSPNIFDLLGFTPEEMKSMDFEEQVARIHPDDWPNLRDFSKDLVEADNKDISSIDREFRLMHKSGEYKWIRGTYNLTHDTNGEPDLIVGGLQDITEKKKAEITLRENEEKYRSLTENVNIGIYRNSIGPKGKFIEFNTAFLKIFGYDTKEEISKMNVSDLYQNPQDRNSINTRLIKKGFINKEELLLKRKDGSPIICLVTASAIKDKNGIIKFFDGFIEDITERKQVEEALKKTHEELKNLSVYVDSKLEEDKKKISREIHDGLGQLLTGIKMNLSLLSKNISDKQKTTEKLDLIDKMLDSSIHLIQDISKELRPFVLDDLGICDALQTRVADFEETSGIKCELICQPQHFTVDPEISLSIYRIYLELETNIIRHAKAKKVSVKLQKQKTQISLKVRDYGVGITEKQISSSLSFGLISIRERLNMWKGKMKVEGIPGKGTIVIVQIPIK